MFINEIHLFFKGFCVSQLLSKFGKQWEKHGKMVHTLQYSLTHTVGYCIVCAS